MPTNPAPLSPAALAAIEAARLCLECFRPRATDADWSRYEGGEGEHLCWGMEDCQDRRDEVIPALLSEAREAARLREMIDEARGEVIVKNERLRVADAEHELLREVSKHHSVETAALRADIRAARDAIRALADAARWAHGVMRSNAEDDMSWRSIHGPVLFDDWRRAMKDITAATSLPAVRAAIAEAGG